MGFFALFRKKEPTDQEMRERLLIFVKERLSDRAKRIRVEDAICGLSAVVGERCIDAAGDFPLRNHELAPGSRVFSDRINALLCGDLPDIEVDNLPRETVFGILRTRAYYEAYPPATFPTLKSVFAGYAAGIGNKGDWGKVPVTVLKDNQPWIIPLQFAYETRDKVDAIFHGIKDDRMRCLRLSTQALGDLLNQVSGAIAPEVALRLAFEITNGMAKTAPMTKKAFLMLQKTQA